MVALAGPVNLPMLSVVIEKQFRSSGPAGFRLQLEEEFPPGFTVLFGPSGAGKSTILDCIAGLQLPDAGRISLEHEMFYDSGRQILVPPQQRKIAYVFQSLALFPHLSVQENVAYGVSITGDQQRQSVIEHALRSFHIAELKHRKPNELSGGEQQRVALARSLATDPRVLLLDEPLSGLDARLRQTILQDLREWNSSRRTPILYVTHNRDEVDAIGERVIALAQGRVVARGNPREVLDAPRTMPIAQAAGFENVLSARVQELRPADGVMRVLLPPSSTELEIPLGTAQPGDLIQVAIGAGDILLATEMPRSISARNILPGTVDSFETRSSVVAVYLDAGVRFVVHLTPGALRSLQLTPGAPVWLVLKTHSCHTLSN
jgi:molybdate transport system ATP-binding protein